MDAEGKQKIGQDVMASIEQTRRAAFAKAFPMDKFAKELAILFFSDMADYDGVEVNDVRPRKKTKAIKSIAYTKWGRKLELYDKVSVGRLVADIMGLNAPDKTTLQFDEATLSAILTGLPAGIGEAVRAELSRIVSGKRDR